MQSVDAAGKEGGTAALEKALTGEELTYDDGVQLMKEENLFLLGAAADKLRRDLCGNTVTFVSSYYLNYTNVCAASCPLCAFYRKGNEDDAYTLSTDQIVARAKIAIEQMGATELHIVGGFHPKLGLDYYEDMMRAIKSAYPKVTIKAFTPAEIFFIARLTHNSVKEVLIRLKSAGLDALPGGGAEIFHPETRKKIVVGKCSGDEWLDTARQAHELGIRSNCTMLFGHVEKPEHIVDHVIRIRELHKKTGGFTTFIPLKFSLENTELEQKGLITAESPSTYDLRVIAVSRLLLGNVLKNLSVYWVALGKKIAQVALSYGGNDMVGTAYSEEIFKAAGKESGTSLQELASMVREIKRVPAQRDTFFNIIRRLD
ncbi:MAG: radical SAM protein [Nitrososphaera sp.]|uniref:radical SAM protein n=1 Tax=Nitrososphaera sp. TaxID=1971748 RepID=UPI0017BF6689|nr:radical SAM protein [Nitrososphaera sp.]NWG38320.1 radical SAM protein [Nitrososphaera sp.]